MTTFSGWRWSTAGKSRGLRTRQCAVITNTKKNRKLIQSCEDLIVRRVKSVLDTMSYVIVRTSFNPSAYQSFGPVTYVEYEPENSGYLQGLQDAMASVGAPHPNISSYSCCFVINKPPYIVLNRLKSHAGFKVVAANSIGKAQNGGHWQIWTLSRD